MTKNELLKRLHGLAWSNDDLMEQDTLFEMQQVIDQELVDEHNKGNLTITQLDNGYITGIDLTKTGGGTQ